MLLAASFTVLLLCACASGGTRSDCPYQSLVGQKTGGADIGSLRDAGRQVRILYPDSYLGFGKNPERVNIIRDENDEILAVTCG